jgi:iron(III) transport system ATP-binding protein
MSTEYLLEVDDISCRYGRDRAVDGLSFRARPGSLTCLLGPSGCGKTTALRAIAGFQDLEKGEIRIESLCVSKPGHLLPPERRQVGMVFQDHALFPHLKVTDNVAAGLRHQHENLRRQTVSSLLERMGLSALGERFPHELSGGQQQRVALARALAPRPRLLLMDEPFSNLDLDLRERLAVEVHDLLKEHGITAVMVTHDQYDAFVLGDEVGIMSHGHILQWDTPYNVYHEPTSRFVADFIGNGVFLRGTRTGERTVNTELGDIQGTLDRPALTSAVVDVLIRPDDVLPDPDGAISARVSRKAFKGADIMYTLTLPSGTTLLSMFPSHDNFSVGDHVRVRLNVDHLVVFPIENTVAETVTSSPA